MELLVDVVLAVPGAGDDELDARRLDLLEVRRALPRGNVDALEFNLH